MARRRISLIAAVLLFARTAAAEAPSRVAVKLPSCDDAFDKNAMVSALRIELAADGVRETIVGDGEAIAAIRIEATPCTADVREIVVVIDDAATSKSVRRTIAVDAMPAPSRPRALALAIAELLRASWAELSMVDAPPPREAVPPSIVSAVKLRREREAPRPERTPRTIARIALDTQVFPSYQSVVLGPTIGASVPLFGPLRARADGGVAFGRAYDALGTIDLGIASGDIGVMLAGGTESVRFDLGPLVRVGYGWASGHPISGGESGHTSGVVLTGGLAASVFVRLAGDWWSVAGLEGGAVIQSVDAQAASRPAAGFGGPLVAVTLGLGHEL
jgi:hypothetical protein